MSSVKTALISVIFGILLLAGGVSGATNVSSCQAITTPGVYVLNQSINSTTSNCITIESSNVTFDGADYSITGPGSSYYGIYVYTASTTLTNVTVKNAVATGWNKGMDYRSAENGSILNNNVSDNYYGIYLRYSDSNTLTNNNANNNNYDGIRLYYSSNNTITDNTASSNGDRGIYFYYSDSNTLTDNNASSNTQYGIYIHSSDSNTLSGNTMTGNTKNFRIYGTQDSHYDQNIDTTNTVNGKPVYYIKGASGTTYDSSTNAGWFGCVNCDNVTVKDLTLTNNYPGLLFWNTSNSDIRNVNVRDSDYGIYIGNSNDITVANNTLEDNSNYGVYFYNVDPSSISGNYINGSNDGIYIDASTDITVDSNTIVNSSNSQIYASSTSNVNATNNNLYGWTGTTTTTYTGVYYSNVNPGVISGNFITHSIYGVYTSSGANIAIDSNTIVNSSSYSVYSRTASNVNATNNNLYGWTGTTAMTGTGVYYYSVNPGVISGNNILHSSNGVYTSSGANIAIDSNTIVNSSSYSVYSRTASNVNATNNNLYGWTGTTATTYTGVYYSSVNPGVISGNNILHSSNGVYTDSGANIAIDSNTIVNSSNRQIYAYSTSNVNATNNNLYGWTGTTATTSYGVYYTSVNSGVISGNNILHSSSYGVYTSFGANIAIDSNTIVNSSNMQIWASSASNVNVTNNNLYGWTGTTATTSYGVYYSSVNPGVISGNSINASSLYGLYLISTNNNIITNNTITNNTLGAYLTSSGTNTIYNNYFNNTNNAYDNNNNDWNTTKQAGTNIIGDPWTGGNFWAYPNGTGFSEGCDDADSDGICDSSRNIAGGSNVDYLPLTDVTRWTLSPDTLPPLEANATNGSGIINLTDRGVPQHAIDQMGVTGYEYIVTTNGTTPAVNISVTIFTEPPSGVNSSGADDVPGFYYKINVNDSSWFDNVTMVQLRIYYNPLNINLPAGVTESTLRPIRYTNGSWVRLDCSALGGCTATLDDGTELYAAGVVTSSQNATHPYLWANLSNFSVYGVGGAIVAASTGSSGGVYTPEVVVLANSIDSGLATDFFEFLRSKRITVIQASASDFSQYKSKKFIVILGGPDAYEGVGDIVNEALDESEQAFSSTSGNRETYVKTNVWRTDMVSQRVWVIAGGDRELTMEEVSDSQADVAYEVKYAPTST